MGVSAAPITWMSLGEIDPQQGAGDVWLREGQVNTRQQMQLAAANRALSKSLYHQASLVLAILVES